MAPKLFLSLGLILAFALTSCGQAGPALREPTLAATIALPTDASAPLPGDIPEPTATATLLPGEVHPIWLTNPVDRAVLQIDPRENQITTRITVAGQPDRLAVDGNDVWVLDQANDRVFHIDGESAHVIGEIDLPAGEAGDIAAGDGAAWVGMTGKVTLGNQVVAEEPNATPPGFIVRIDADSNKVAQTLPVAQPVERLLLRGQALWVLSRTVIDTPIHLYDLRGGEGVIIPLSNGPEWLPVDALAVGPENLWIFSAAHSAVFRVGFEGRIQARVALPEAQPKGYAQMALAANSLYLATPWGSIVHIDATTNHLIGSAELGVPFTSLTVQSGAAWVLSQQTGSVFRLDPNTLQVLAQISTGSALAPTVVASPTSRVVVWKPCLDAATSRLKIGDIAYVTKDPPIPNRIRQEPNREAEILGLINPGGSMDIIDGPTCADGWVWWKVKTVDYEGWTAEGDLTTYWLVPLLP